MALAGPLVDRASMSRVESFVKSKSLAANSFDFSVSDGVLPLTIFGN
jgi:hypothetical protein